MILQALTQYYETLVQAGVLAGPGWGPVKASYALSIAADGTLEQVTSIQTEQLRGKKTVLAPQVLTLPAPVKRTVGIAANFLCEIVHRIKTRHHLQLAGIHRFVRSFRTAAAKYCGKQ